MLKNKNLYFRINSKKNIGFGHLARCLEVSLNVKMNCNFIVDDNSNFDFINKKIIKFYFLYDKGKFKNEMEDAIKVYNIIKNKKNAILIVDDYRIGFIWHKFFRKKKIKVVVIDDLLNRKFDCNLYINYKLDTSLEFKKKLNRYINKDAIKLIGPNYSIINKKLKDIKNDSFYVMFNFGNSFDYREVSKQIINIHKETRKKFKKLIFLLPIGHAAKNYDEIIKYSKKNNSFNVIFKKFGISNYLNKTNLFIGSASNSIYEMAYLKKPSIFIVMNKIQQYNVLDLENFGHYFLIDFNEFKNKKFIKLFFNFLKNYKGIKQLFNNRKYKIDKYGAKRIQNT